MTLIELLQAKIDKLNDEYDAVTYEQMASIKDLTEDKSRIQSLLNSLENDISDVHFFDYNKITELIQKYSEEEFDVADYEKKLKHIGVTYSAIASGLDVSLTLGQEQFLVKFINDLQNTCSFLQEEINSQNEKTDGKIASLASNITSYNKLVEKVANNKDILDTNDFELIYKIIQEPDFSYEDKRDSLIEFRMHNNLLGTRNASKEVLTEEEPTIDKLETDAPTVTIDDVKDCFRKYNVSDEVYEDIDKYDSSVLKHAKIDNINEILEYLNNAKIKEEDRIGIIKRFSPIALLTVAVLGEKETVAKQFEKMKKSNRFDKAFFETASIWTKDVSSKMTKRGRRKREKHNPNNDSLYNSLLPISYEDMLYNEQFLTSKGFDVSINAGKAMSTIKRPSALLEENYDILNEYGIFNGWNLENFPSSVLVTNQAADRCDNLIEIGLLHGENFGNISYTNYAHRYPSILRKITDDNITLAYYLISKVGRSEYYQKIFSENRDGMLKPDFLINNFNHSPLAIEEMKKKEFVDLYDTKNIPNVASYDEIIKLESPTNYNPSILSIPEIMNLEENHRVPGNEYIYKFGDQVISRLKVLRCYSALKEYGGNDEDRLLYCITRNTLMREDTFSQIKQEISYGQGKGERK